MACQPAPPGVDFPQVLYIVGLGRSGSTLLERILGAIPGFTNGGELVDLFVRVAVQDQRCGCGQPFSGCPFWRSVGEQAYGGWEDAHVKRVADLRRRVVRQRRVPFLVAPRLAPAAYRRMLEEYVEVYLKLYRAMAAVSGSRVIVDASKSVAQLFALRQASGLDLRVLNLVRDPRGVAHSWNKSGVKLPHVHDRDDTMASWPPRRSAALWSALQLESAALRVRTPHSALLRYEDLVADPRTALAQTLGALDLAPEGDRLEHVDRRGVTLGSSHGIAGSPSRFTTGRIELRPDEEWRSGLAAASRRTVTAMTIPQLIGYRYVGLSRRGAR